MEENSDNGGNAAFAAIGLCVIGLSGVLVSTSGYILSSIVVSPFLGLGACFKSIALNDDGRASEYNQLMYDHFNELSSIDSGDKLKKNIKILESGIRRFDNDLIKETKKLEKIDEDIADYKLARVSGPQKTVKQAAQNLAEYENNLYKMKRDALGISELEKIIKKSEYALIVLTDKEKVSDDLQQTFLEKYRKHMASENMAILRK